MFKFEIITILLACSVWARFTPGDQTLCKFTADCKDTHFPYTKYSSDKVYCANVKIDFDGQSSEGSICVPESICNDKFSMIDKKGRINEVTVSACSDPRVWILIFILIIILGICTCYYKFIYKKQRKA